MVISADFLNPENKLLSSAICIQFVEDFIGIPSSGIPELHIMNEFLNRAKLGIQFVRKTHNVLVRHIKDLPSTERDGKADQTTYNIRYNVDKHRCKIFVITQLYARYNKFGR